MGNRITRTIKTKTFRNVLKLADVTPMYKRNDPLDKVKYRPVNVLPCISKLSEVIYCRKIGWFLGKCLVTIPVNIFVMS